jgi:hypothetical protein
MANRGFDGIGRTFVLLSAQVSACCFYKTKIDLLSLSLSLSLSLCSQLPQGSVDATTSAAACIAGQQRNGHLGDSPLLLLDFNGDGVSEVVAGAPRSKKHAENGGTVKLFNIV